MPNFRMTLSYDGTRYNGWQRQGNTPDTVQGRLETALSALLGQPVEVAGSGRTDAGVHARMQTASFRAKTDLPAPELLRRLRARLPGDIGVLTLEETAPRFHARLSCRGKTYVYRVWNSDTPNVFERRYVYALPQPLDTAAMQRAAALLCAAVCTVGIDPPDFAHTSKSVLSAMGTGLLHPDWRFFFGTGKDGLGWLLLETVGIALAGTGLGALLAAPLAFLGTPKLLPRPVALLFRVLIVAIRSVPFLIYGLIFIRVSGPGAFTGVLTLAVCSIGLLSKRFTEAIEALDFRAYDALRAMGVSLLPRIRYAVLPQLAPALASAVLYRFDVNIREASVLGLVGAGGIGAPLIFAMNQYAWSDVSAIFLGFVLLVWGIDVGSARLRHRRSTAAASE